MKNNERGGEKNSETDKAEKAVVPIQSKIAETKVIWSVDILENIMQEIEINIEAEVISDRGLKNKVLTLFVVAQAMLEHICVRIFDELPKNIFEGKVKEDREKLSAELDEHGYLRLKELSRFLLDAGIINNGLHSKIRQVNDYRNELAHSGPPPTKIYWGRPGQNNDPRKSEAKKAIEAYEGLRGIVGELAKQ